MHDAHGNDPHASGAPLGKWIYHNGRYIAKSTANTSSLTQSMQYGTTAFEGMRAYYRGPTTGWALFRPDRHYERLARGAAMIDIDLAMECDEFCRVVAALVRRNDIRTDVYVRPIVYRDTLGVGVTKPSGHSLSIYTAAMPRHDPLRVTSCLVDQRRPTDGTYAVKLAGNYLLSYFAQRDATSRGCDVGILRSDKGHVSEASLMNLFFVRGGTLLTPALGCGPLAGITRASVITLAHDVLGMKVREGKYRVSALAEADEAFLTGTGSGINSIKQFEETTYHDRGRKSVARQLWSLYDSIVSGRENDYQHWMVPIN